MSKRKIDKDWMTFPQKKRKEQHLRRFSVKGILANDWGLFGRLSSGHTHPKNLMADDGKIVNFEELLLTAAPSSLEEILFCGEKKAAWSTEAPDHVACVTEPCFEPRFVSWNKSFKFGCFRIIIFDKG